MTALTKSSPQMRLLGKRIADLDTPSLLLDAAALDRNLRTMAAYFAGKPCQLRPHFKNHKCATLARRQLAAGTAVGITCAKLGEAEVLADAGFEDLLIANQVVGPPKVARLVEVAKKTKVAVAIDSVDQAAAISEAAGAARVTVGLLIEVDIGMGRCGVQPGEPALELAQQIALLPGVRFEGIQAFEGHIIYVNDHAERARLARASMQKAVDTKELLERHGIAVGVISGGSSSTYRFVADLPGVRELQAGTYPTMDWRYQQVAPEFEVAMTILTRVISKRPGVAVLDLGIKGAGAEFGVPRIKGHPEVEVPFFLSEEHCVVKNAPADWRVGTTVEMIASHACTTCNLHREFVVHEGGKVVDAWPIEAAGRLS